MDLDTDRMLENWREAKDRTIVAVTAAAHSGLIGDLELLTDGQFMMAWGALDDAQREKVLTYRRLGRDVLEPVCRLCGTTFDDARAAKLGDSPGARAQARREMVL